MSGSEQNPFQARNLDFDRDDERISRAFHQVRVPSEGRGRALSALRQAMQAEQSSAADSLGQIAESHFQVVAPAMERASENASVVSSGCADSDRADSDVLPFQDANSSAQLRKEHRGVHISRRRWLAAAAVSSVATGLGWRYWSMQPLSQIRLRNHCVSRLQALLDPETIWNAPEEMGWRRLQPLLRDSVAQLQPVGWRVSEPGGIAEELAIWKFETTQSRRPLVVFDFQRAHSVQGLQGRLQILSEESGRWTLAGLQRESQILIAATPGPLADFFAVQPLA